MKYKLGSDLEAEVKKQVDDWQNSGKVKQLWSGDTKLWTGADENKWLGWLNIASEELANLDKLKALNADIKEAGFTHALLIGMGGSSLGPAVLASAFGQISGNPKFLMLDSTVPEQIQAIEKQLDLDRTIFIVSSKSGSTLEPNILKDYFFEKVKSRLGADEAGRHFIAVTDPGSQMEEVANEDGFRYVFHGLPSIGGRYSILSAFGMVPAAIMGIDLKKFLDKVQSMAQSCAASVPVSENPGAMLGVILGVLANKGRDKITFVTSPAITELGAWLEQLLAESTGKNGKGLIPIVGEFISPPADYGSDRLFIYITLANSEETDSETTYEQAQESLTQLIQDGVIDTEEYKKTEKHFSRLSIEKAIDELERSGQPVVRIELNDKYDLAQEFFRFEMATAVAGSIMGINPFNQPDVEAAKIAARKLTSEYEKTGKLPEETASFTEASTDYVTEIFADQPNWTNIIKHCQDQQCLSTLLKSYFSQVKPGDYVAILAYLDMSPINKMALRSMRQNLHKRLKIATCLGFGPRYLHSTGQVYKGGPNSGVFLQITADDTVDFPVPNKHYTFSVVKAAQALGDFQVLAERKRRIIRVHLKSSKENLANHIIRFCKDMDNAFAVPAER